MRGVRRRGVRAVLRKLVERVRPSGQGRRECADGRAGAPLLVHVHIPKCAGSTFKRILSLTFGERHQDWYSEDPFFFFEAEEIASRLAQHPEIASIASHSIRSFPQRMGERVPLYVTFLRNPIDQFVSYITFLKKNKPHLTETHRLYVPPDVDLMTVRDIAHWLVGNEHEVPFKSNYTVRFLSEIEFRRHTASLTELLDGREASALRDLYERVALDLAVAVLERFFFVGIVEEMENSVALVGERLKQRGLELGCADFRRENVSEHFRGDLGWLDESDAVGRLVFQSLAKDVRLYEHFRERLYPHSPRTDAGGRDVTVV